MMWYQLLFHLCSHVVILSVAVFSRKIILVAFHVSVVIVFSITYVMITVTALCYN